MPVPISISDGSGAVFGELTRNSEAGLAARGEGEIAMEPENRPRQDRCPVLNEATPANTRTKSTFLNRKQKNRTTQHDRCTGLSVLSSPTGPLPPPGIPRPDRGPAPRWRMRGLRQSRQDAALRGEVHLFGVDPYDQAASSCVNPGLACLLVKLPVRFMIIGLTRIADICYAAFVGAVEMTVPRLETKSSRTGLWCLGSLTTSPPLSGMRCPSLNLRTDTCAL